MKFIITAGLLVLSLAAGGTAYAAEATTQQTKMSSCNKDAGAKKGDERKAFMKECLSAPAPAKAAETNKLTPQQSKMGTCNKEAAGKKGDERKAFMKECLSAKKAS